MATRTRPITNERDPDLTLIAATQRAILAFADERIACAGSPPDDAQRMRDEAAALSATIGERLRADLQQRRSGRP